MVIVLIIVVIVLIIVVIVMIIVIIVICDRAPNRRYNYNCAYGFCGNCGICSF